MPLIVGEEVKRKRAKRRAVKSVRNHDVTPGIHYAIVDMTQRGMRHDLIDHRYTDEPEHVNMADLDRMGENPIHKIDGQRIMLRNHVGFTEDPEMAAAARAAGLKVIPREKHVASSKAFFGFSDLPNWDKIDWSKDKKEQ